MWIWLGNSLCLLPPPLFTPRGYCSIFTFFCFINQKHYHFSTAAFRCHYVQFPVVAGLYRRGHPPQPMRKASTCLCLFSLSYITITPVLPIPSWRRKLATEFLKYLAVMVRATPPHGTVNHFPHHVICVLSHRYNYLRLPLLKYITTRRNSNSHCQTGNRLHNAPNSFSYLGGYSQLMTSRPYTYPYHFRIIT